MSSSTAQDERDDFEHWLAFQEDALADFLEKNKLDADADFSIESLGRLESWLLESFQSPDDLERHSDQWDGASRYVGEVLRRNGGGKWHLSLESPKSVFFGLPVIRGLAKGNAPEICPTTLVSTTVSRRTGDFLTRIAQRLVLT